LINEGLITEGALATYHWLDRTALAQGPHKLLIQASRGGVVDEQALLEVLNHSDSRLAVIDVWEGEPEVNKRLLEKAFVATPHIAGYSQQAKIMATVSIMLQLNRFFGISTTPVEQLRKQWMQGLVPTAPLQPLSKNAAYPVPEPLMQDYLVYDRKLRQGILDPDPTQAADPAAYFRYLRTSIPFRFEYASWKPYMESIDFREAWPFWAHLAV
jgi:erythronate-4-phosphate dehydrogenase